MVVNRPPDVGKVYVEGYHPLPATCESSFGLDPDDPLVDTAIQWMRQYESLTPYGPGKVYPGVVPGHPIPRFPTAFTDLLRISSRVDSVGWYLDSSLRREVDSPHPLEVPAVSGRVPGPVAGHEPGERGPRYADHP